MALVGTIETALNKGAHAAETSTLGYVPNSLFATRYRERIVV